MRASEYFRQRLDSGLRLLFQSFQPRADKQSLESQCTGLVRISRLPNRNLVSPLDAVVESDGDGYIARTIDFPLYGNGEDPIEALDNLRANIEELYEDLLEEDEFTEEWLSIKRFLIEKVESHR